MAWYTETTHSGAVARVTEDGGGVESIPVGIGRVKAEGASSKVCASLNTPPVRSAQTRGLTYTANTCFLNASLPCLGRVWELNVVMARQPRRSRSLDSRLLECISQLQLRLSSHYTPRPLLDTLPRIADWAAGRGPRIPSLPTRQDGPGWPAGSLLWIHPNGANMLNLPP